MPSTSDSPRSITASKTLSVALAGGGGAPLSGGNGVLAFSAPNGFVDGQTLTVTADSSIFGAAPKDVATFGFGQGLLQEQAIGTQVQNHIDPLSGAAWTWERNSKVDPSGYTIDETEGIRGFRTGDKTDSSQGLNLGGGFLSWEASEDFAAYEDVFISRLVKFDAEFINVTAPSEWSLISSISGQTITLDNGTPWAGNYSSADMPMFVCKSKTISATYREIRGAANFGDTTITVDTDIAALGYTAGDWVALRPSTQYKEARFSNTGGYGTAVEGRPYPNFYISGPYVSQAQNDTIVIDGRLVSLEGVTRYDGSAPCYLKNWYRLDSIMNFGGVGVTDGYFKTNLISKTKGGGFYPGEFTPTPLKMHNSNWRIKWISFQAYYMFTYLSELWNADTLIQRGSFARVELADTNHPDTCTEAYVLPPVLANWTSNSIEVHLWKSLAPSYTGMHLHVYNSSNIFEGALSL